MWGESKAPVYDSHDAKALQPGFVDTLNQAGVAHTSKDLEDDIKENYSCSKCNKRMVVMYDLKHTRCNQLEAGHAGWEYRLLRIVANQK